MQKAFSFSEPSPDEQEAAKTKSHVLVITVKGNDGELRDEKFELNPAPEGATFLALAGRSINATGTHNLISVAIRDDDWDRWVTATRFCKLQDFGRIATGIIDLYADFPTTAEAGS